MPLERQQTPAEAFIADDVHRRRRRLFALGKIAVAVGLIYWLLRSGRLDPARLAEAFVTGGTWVLLGSLGVMACIVFGGIRWHFLLRALGVRVPLAFCVRLSFIGAFFSTALPGSVGGDVIRAYYASRREGVSRTVAITSVILDRVIGLFVLFPVAAAAVLAQPGLAGDNPALQGMRYGVKVVTVCLALAMALAFSRRFRESRLLRAVLAKMPGQGLLQGLRDRAGTMTLNGDAILGTLVAAVAIPIVVGASYAAFGRSLGERTLPFATYFFVSPFVNIAMALPIAPAGIGTGQAAAMKVFEWILRRPSSFGADLMTLYHLARLVAALVGAVVYLSFEERSRAR